MKEKRELQFDSLVKTGHWVNNSTNDGLMYVNAKGVPIINKKGSRFEFKFIDAISGDSRLLDPEFELARSDAFQEGNIIEPIFIIP